MPMFYFDIFAISFQKPTRSVIGCFHRHDPHPHFSPLLYRVSQNNGTLYATFELRVVGKPNLGIV